MTSIEASRRAGRIQLAVVVGALLVALIVILVARSSAVAAVVLRTVGPLAVLVVMIFLPRVPRRSERRRKEHLAGYTLTRTRRLDLDQVDPATGYVIREAGQPALTIAEQKAAIAALRAEQSVQPPPVA